VQAKVPQLSLLERIQKVEDLSILVEKRSQLQASLREISQFKLSSDSMSNRVSIRNAATQREFNTSNSEVISEIIDVIIRKVEGKLSEVEAMITF
jgi:abortive infection bacteriophage resistance protein